MYAVDYIFILVIALTAGSLGLWARSAFRKYELEPAAADSYRSKAAVMTVNIMYVAVPIAMVWLIGLALRILDKPG